MFRLLILSLCVYILTACVAARTAGAARVLRVCSDPDSLPFSNAAQQGFENKIAQLVASELHASLQYEWHSQGSEFISQTLNAGKCDVLINVPAAWDEVLTTTPYYASSYVFVYPRRGHARLDSFDDPALRKLRIGLPMMGGDTNGPAASELAKRGLETNVIGFPTFTRGKIINAVAAGEVDVAIVWGPFGGYFAKHQHVPLSLTPVSEISDDPSVRLTYPMAMGVRRQDTSLKNELESVIEHRHKDLTNILEGYGVPEVAFSGSSISAK